MLAKENCSISEAQEDGGAKPPIRTVVVKANGKTVIVPSASYEAVYKNNTAGGIATVEITGTGNFKGTVTKTFSIGTDLSKGTVTLAGSTYSYTTGEIKPVVTSVILNEEEVSSDYYDVTYSNNVNVGTGIVTVTGKNGYAGSIETTFTIEERSVNDDVIEYGQTDDYVVYTGQELTPELTIKNKAVTPAAEMTKGTDYTTVYSNNVEPGIGRVVVLGVNNYNSSAAKTFRIVGDISKASATAEVKTTIKGEKAEIKADSFKDADIDVAFNGKKLTLDTDYKITAVKLNDGTKTGTITIEGINSGNSFYTGTRTLGFNYSNAAQNLTVDNTNGEVDTAHLIVSSEANSVTYSEGKYSLDVGIAYTITNNTDKVLTLSGNDGDTRKIGIGKTATLIVADAVDYTIKLHEHVDQINFVDGKLIRTCADGDDGETVLASLSLNSELNNGVYGYHYVDTITPIFIPVAAYSNDLSIEYTDAVDKATGKVIPYSAINVLANKQVNESGYTLNALITYKGTPYQASVDYTVEPKDITGNATIILTLDELSYTYSKGTFRKPDLTVKDTARDNAELTEIEYSSDLEEHEDADTYTVTVTGKGNYTGTKSISWTIEKADNPAAFTNTGDSKTYDGEKFDVTVFVPENNEVTYKYAVGTFYDTNDDAANWDDAVPVNANTYTVKADIAESNNFKAVTIYKTYTINRRPITVIPIAGQKKIYGTSDPEYYTCTTDDDVANRENQNFSEYIGRNAGENVDTYDYTITDEDGFVGNYAISIDPANTNTFEIVQKDIEGLFTPGPTEFIYDGTEKTLTVTGNYDDATAEITKTLGTDDYDISDNVQTNVNRTGKAEVGTYTAKVTGKGNYTGEVTFTYKINPKDITNDDTVTLALDHTSYTYQTGVTNTPELTVTDTARNAVLTGADYTSDLAGQEPVGNYTVTVEGQGNYTGTKTVGWTIEKADVDISVDEKTGGITYDAAAVDDSDFVVEEHNSDTNAYTLTYYADNNGTKGEKLDAAPTNAGYYWVEASMEATNNFKAVTSTAVRFTINRATATITPTAGQSQVYGAKTENLAFTVDGLQGNDTQEAVFAVNPLMVVDSNNTKLANDHILQAGGSYYLAIDPSKTYDNYKIEQNGENAAYTVTRRPIFRAEAYFTATAFDKSDNNEFIYDGTRKNVSIAVKDQIFNYGGNSSEVELTLGKNNDYTSTGSTRGTDAGEYKITIKGWNNYTDTSVVSWGITKQFTSSVVVTDGDTSTEGIISGEEYTVSVDQSDANFPSDPEIKYYYKVMDSTEEYTETKPTEAGTYEVYAVISQAYYETYATAVTEFTIEAPATVAEAKIYANSLDLNGNIDFAMYLGLKDYGDTTGYTYKATLTTSLDDSRSTLKDSVVLEGSVQNIAGSEYGTNIMFNLALAPTELTDKIHVVADIYNNSNKKVDTVETDVCVADYVARMLKKSNGAVDARTEMFAALMHYGNAAQELFGYNTENMADSIFDDEDIAHYKDMGKVAKTYEEALEETELIDKAVVTEKLQTAAPELSYYGSSVDHVDGTKFYHFFTVSGITADEAVTKYQNSFTVSGNYALTVTTAGDNLIRVETGKIPPAELADSSKFTYSVNGTEIMTYTVMSYAKAVSSGTNENLKKLNEKLYYFSETAKLFFDNRS